MELAQSRTEQKTFLKNVELARVLEKRARKKGEANAFQKDTGTHRKLPNPEERDSRKRIESSGLEDVLQNVF